ncbi:DUF1700 domain-containing protein [Chromobacterium piscinae]|uniref:DUF1700 domain-containing protein n=1 Tax=Chromobacterium piscinae TaxID=686831 RepID=A0ABV0H553_9NEIS|nr:DUF1700 domain-containing protein [Chromobacterium piscinae]MBX9297317.1 DUF1700 domain-containing protein [Chromobacterium vaccinii]MBX9346244.1 DUF1700 domain-containing protein [Chromobacterium vaccinii]MBX9355979.1 DUF1700 domain-containing protein [Chromobacterium vaccinii]MCD4503444.1 DUF1700 domain-containing protein [Chromobacterium piscinae]MCD5329224.1 DUF1700 domain-containing protein [Chromobacterium piscinae]
MTRKEFLRQLEQALSGLKPEAVREILADYDEYFSDAQADGRDEAEVVEALGSPQKLARELKAQTHYRQWQEHRSFANLTRVVASIAGLGVLNFILAIPLLVYLLFLTVGYIASVGFLLSGLAVVLAWGSHSLFGWPQFTSDGSGWYIGRYGDSGAEMAWRSEMDDHSGQVWIDKGLLMLEPDDGDRFELKTSQGALLLVSKSGGKLAVDASQPAVRELARVDDGQVSIDGGAIRELKLREDSGDVFTARVDDGKRLETLDVSAGGTVLKLVASGPNGSISLKDGDSTLEISERSIELKDGMDHIQIDALPGLSVGMSALVVGLMLLLGGSLGLVFCVWLTRLTWRALVAYVKYQIELVSGKDGENAAA